MKTLLRDTNIIKKIEVKNKEIIILERKNGNKEENAGRNKRSCMKN